MTTNAILTRETVQRLAVLRALMQWSKGAYGPVRLQKTLFFADKENDPKWRFFTFKKHYLGQYSDEVSEVLNQLQKAERVETHYDGPSQRIVANISWKTREMLTDFFDTYFAPWSMAFDKAFKEWAYLNSDDVIRRAHSDATYTKAKFGEMIFRSQLAAFIEFEGLSFGCGEYLSDLVDDRLHRNLQNRLTMALEKPVAGEDWRSKYFPEGSPLLEAVSAR